MSTDQKEKPMPPPRGKPLTTAQKELIELLARAAAQEYLNEQEEQP